MAEQFDVNAYLRCDCATVENQTCDKCAVRGHIAALTKEAAYWRREAEAYPQVRMYRGDYSLIRLEVEKGDEREFVPARSATAPLSENTDLGSK